MARKRTQGTRGKSVAKGRTGKGRTRAAADRAVRTPMTAAVTVGGRAPAVGTRVRLAADAEDLRAGAVGTVTQQADMGDAWWVLFDGRETEMLVPERHLEPVLAMRAVASAFAADTRDVGGEGCRVGARVRITVDAADVRAGTAGTVCQAAPNGNASWVLFDGRATQMLVPNRFLVLAQQLTQGLRERPGA